MESIGKNFNSKKSPQKLKTLNYKLPSLSHNRSQNIPHTANASHHPKKIPSLKTKRKVNIVSKAEKSNNSNPEISYNLPNIRRINKSLSRNENSSISKKKDITPQICNLFHFKETGNYYLFAPNSKYHLSPPNAIFEILEQQTIPFSYKMRIYKFSNMPQCIIDTCNKSNITYKKKFENCNIIWHLFHPDKIREIIRTMHKNQRFNHFPTSFQLDRKDNLYRHFRCYKQFFPKDYNYAPTTFILPFDSKHFESEYEHSKKQKWIVKPVNLSRGRGVHLLKNEDEYKRLLQASSEENTTHYLLSKYISNTHTINKKKYDLRIYVLITSFSPLRIYMYNNGLVRFATEDYVQGNYDNIYVHVTNFSINKNNVKYKSNQKNNINIEEGEECEQDDDVSKWSFIEYKAFFMKNQLMEQHESLFKKIKDIIIKTIITIAGDSAKEISYNKYFSVFELFGFDIMVDEKFVPWLIEVNVNPSLHCTSPLDLAIKSDLIADVFNVVGVIPYHHQLNNYKFGENMENKEQKKEESSKEYFAIRLKLVKEVSEGQGKINEKNYNCSFYRKMLTLIKEEFERRSLTGFELLFPKKGNIEMYSKFLLKEGINDCNIVLWNEIMKNKINV